MTIAISIVMALPAAFVIARQRGVMVTLVSGWVRLAQVVGGIAVIIPLYLILRELHLVNTLLGVSLAEAIPCSAFATWVLVSYVRQIPVEIEEAAILDGAGNWQVVLYVVLPLIRPGLLSVVLVVFFISWNDFLGPLILINDPERYTVTVALFTFIGQVGQVDWGTLLAFATLACLPAVVVIVLAERHLVSGLVAGSGK
jgi:multiple sugar transport system permease protein